MARKVRFTTTGISTNKPVTTNRTHYFMPNESVGLGTATTGTATLTPTNSTGFTTIAFDAVGENALLLFTNSGWNIISANGATIA